MKKERLASETIYSSKSFIIPFCDVAFIQKDLRSDYEGAVTVVMKCSKWQDKYQQWSPSIYLDKAEGLEFKKHWCRYRSEIDPVISGPGHEEY